MAILGTNLYYNSRLFSLTGYALRSLCYVAYGWNKYIKMIFIIEPDSLDYSLTKCAFLIKQESYLSINIIYLYFT